MSRESLTAHCRYIILFHQPMNSRVRPYASNSLISDGKSPRTSRSKVLGKTLVKRVGRGMTCDNNDSLKPFKCSLSFLGSDDEYSDVEFAEYEPSKFKSGDLHLLNHATSSLYRQPQEDEHYPELFFSQKSLCFSNQSYYQGNDKRSHKTRHNIPQDPSRIIDIPGYIDDYASKPVDWSVEDHLLVALPDGVYIFSVENGDAFKLHCSENERETVSAVTFSPEGRHAAMGTHDGRILIYDIAEEALVNSYEDDDAIEKVASLEWSENGLLAAAKDSIVGIYDFRKKRPTAKEFVGHNQNLFNISWSPSGDYLASGGYDHQVFIWDLKTNEAAMKLNHKGSIRAMAWSPFQANILATGGGSSDRCIRTWDIATNNLVDMRETCSQVCTLQFSHLTKDLITTHSNYSNEICVWRTNGLKKIGSMIGHEERALTLCISPDKSTILTASSDETMRLWKLYDIDDVPVERVTTRDTSIADRKNSDEILSESNMEKS
jgi:cell division cycle protein 20 (cofactor of APC complex)